MSDAVELSAFDAFLFDLDGVITRPPAASQFGLMVTPQRAIDLGAAIAFPRFGGATGTTEFRRGEVFLNARF